MSATSVMLALFSNALAAPSSMVGVGAAETKVDARRAIAVENFIVKAYEVIW